MTRIRVLFAAALMTLVVLAAVPTAQAGQRRNMIRAINYVRSWSHLRGLRYSERLSRASAGWARYLMRRQMLAHATHVQGEVIEWHTGADAQVNSVVLEWLHSAGHRRVMLGHYRRAGAGRAVGWFDGQRCTIWVVRFAR